MAIQRWNEPGYQRISSVRKQGDEIVVSFEDGTTVSLGADQLLSPDAHSPAWNALSFDAYEIVVPTSLGEAEIPWTTIRLLTDKEFAVHWANAAEKQAKQIGLRLRELRKRRNLTGKEVAERAGITPQSLSRIERGHHGVVFTTLRKILAAMGCTLQDLAEVQVAPPSLETLLKHLETVGLKKEWVLNRMLPEDLLKFEDDGTDRRNNTLISEVARHISHIFKWSPDSILNCEPLMIDPTIAQAARFKAQGRTQEIQATAYAVYTHFLSLLVIDATKHIPTLQLPRSSEEIREAVIGKYNFLSFESLVRYVWGLGIPVVPLQDSGAFHGACWRLSGRNIIVLKQVTPYQARWLFDLAHELAHVILHLSNERTAIIESEEITPFQDSDEEWEASEFADGILLDGRSEELAEMSAKKVQGKVEFLKSGVIQVAATEHVPVDVLANYLAYRLSKTNKINWWGTANNLQITEPSPMDLARQVFFEHVSLEQLSPIDQDLVMRALS